MYCILLLYIASPTSAQDSQIATIENSVVQIGIEFPTKDDKPVRAVTSGTGFVVGDGSTLVTAAHVFWSARNTINKRRGGTLVAMKNSRTSGMFSVRIKPIHIDDIHDVVILRFNPAPKNEKAFSETLEQFNIKSLELAEREPQMGEEVFFIGYFGQDRFPTLSRGVVSGFATIKTASGSSVEEIIFDIPANKGQSGSPLVLKETGKVIGVVGTTIPITLVTGAKPSHSGLSRAVRIEHVKKLVESLEQSLDSLPEKPN